jgi:Ca-activated chloride channel family protein
MNFTEFNFQHVTWLWALSFIPLIFITWAFKRSTTLKNSKLERFADKHLLPFLVKKSVSIKNISRKNLIIWSLSWTLGVLALAGPRWSFKEIEGFKSQKNLVVLLSLSDAMNAQDIKPSRLVRAREKIDDILNDNTDINIGLIAFAKDAHLVTPITEDKNSIKYLLSALQTDLASVQGSRLAPALNMADQLLKTVPGNDKTVLIMSDGNFDDSKLSQSIDQLTRHGIKVSTMGFGTNSGAPILKSSGAFLKDNGHIVISQLNQKSLYQISREGGGRYFLPDDLLNDQTLFSLQFNRDASERSSVTTKDWEPRFYIFLIPLLLLMLPFFRQGSFSNQQKNFLKAALFILLISTFGLSKETWAAESNKPPPQPPSSLRKLFENQDTLGKEALDSKDYKSAIAKFKDPYRLGVAQYKAGNFVNAEESFRKSLRPEVKIPSEYNLGNSLAQEGKYQEAIQAYENVLKQQPNHERAKANLKTLQDLLKKHPEDQKQAQTQKHDQSQKQSQGQKQGQEQKQTQGQSQNENQNQDKKNQNQNQKPARSQAQEQNQKQNQDQKPEQGKKPGEDQKQAKNQSQKPSQTEEKNQRQQENSPSIGGQTESQNLKHDEQIRARKAQQDVDADQWLNRITNDPHSFLKNQFLIESLRAQAKKGE